MLNSAPLPASFVSIDDLMAIMPPKVLSKAGMPIVTLKCEEESFLESALRQTRGGV